ncbi:MAG: exoprotein, partial [Sphingomonadaceae bacterium]
MTEVQLQATDIAQEVPPVRRRWLRAGLLALAAILVVSFASVWFGREKIADYYISGQLDSYDVPATYNVSSVDYRSQVLTDIVIGDPQRPDMTIERAEIALAYRWGMPEIHSVRLVKPRLYGRWADGRLSFGSLDRVIYTDSIEPFTLPDLVLDMEDGRALLEMPFGPIGIKAGGKGNLSGGFDGILAATGPEISMEGCTIREPSLFGRVTTRHKVPTVRGPLRFVGLGCKNGVRLGASTLQVEA